MIEAAPLERRRPPPATLVGMPTLSSHGPRSTTALPKKRSTPSTAGEHRACAAPRAAARRVDPVGLPMYRSASRLRASTTALRVGQRHDRAFRQRNRRESVCERVEVEAEASTPTTAPVDAHRIGEHDRRLAGHRPVDSSLTTGLPVDDLLHVLHRQPRLERVARQGALP